MKAVQPCGLAIRSGPSAWPFLSNGWVWSLGKRTASPGAAHLIEEQPRSKGGSGSGLWPSHQISPSGWRSAQTSGVCRCGQPPICEIESPQSIPRAALKHPRSSLGVTQEHPKSYKSYSFVQIVPNHTNHTNSYQNDKTRNLVCNISMFEGRTRKTTKMYSA